MANKKINTDIQCPVCHSQVFIIGNSWEVNGEMGYTLRCARCTTKGKATYVKNVNSAVIAYLQANKRISVHPEPAQQASQQSAISPSYARAVQGLGIANKTERSSFVPDSDSLFPFDGGTPVSVGAVEDTTGIAEADDCVPDFGMYEDSSNDEYDNDYAQETELSPAVREMRNGLNSGFIAPPGCNIPSSPAINNASGVVIPPAPKQRDGSTKPSMTPPPQTRPADCPLCKLKKSIRVKGSHYACQFISGNLTYFDEMGIILFSQPIDFCPFCGDRVTNSI